MFEGQKELEEEPGIIYTLEYANKRKSLQTQSWFKPNRVLMLVTLTLALGCATAGLWTLPVGLSAKLFSQAALLILYSWWWR